MFVGDEGTILDADLDAFYASVEQRDDPRLRGRPVIVGDGGVARTKFLAKVASSVAKPDGLLVVPPDGELAFLQPLPVERLWASAE
jgi:nucleotidyltransferase/DNA polymerase involved in DNA repair